MELKLQKQPVAVCELLLDTVAEYPIECDLLLPDYCPDIVRVLCCRVQASCSDCSAAFCSALACAMRLMLAMLLFCCRLISLVKARRTRACASRSAEACAPRLRKMSSTREALL